MRILVLGGTVFLGRHIVDSALARGHEVTLFTRGQHNPDLFPTAERLRGDRGADLGALRGRRWDAIIDTSGYIPRVVQRSAEALRDTTDHYTFISTISVYVDSATVGADESYPVGTLEDTSVEEVTGETYGPLKALCERVVEDTLPGRTLVIRPGLIVGPYDPTDRFTYWPRRIAAGGDVLVPGSPGKLIQFIDARDLAEWNLDMVERRAVGLYNATGPNYPLTMHHLIDACLTVSGSDARPIWVDESFLEEAGVQPWSELPVWIPDTDEYKGFHTVRCDRAIEAGLTFRPIERTVADTLDWDRTRPADVEYRAGLPRDREQEVLANWKRRAAEAVPS